MPNGIKFLKQVGSLTKKLLRDVTVASKPNYWIVPPDLWLERDSPDQATPPPVVVEGVL